MAVFGWVVFAMCGIAMVVAGAVYAVVSASFSGRIERMCYGYAIVGISILGFCCTTCPFKIVFK